MTDQPTTPNTELREKLRVFQYNEHQGIELSEDHLDHIMQLIEAELLKARRSEEHYWIDKYSNQISALDGSDPVDLSEKNRLKALRKEHQNRVAELNPQKPGEEEV